LAFTDARSMVNPGEPTFATVTVAFSTPESIWPLDPGPAHNTGALMVVPPLAELPPPQAGRARARAEMTVTAMIAAVRREVVTEVTSRS
jgi:hypothetical protein